MPNSRNLKLSEVPAENAELDEIIEFVRTMDGYEAAGSFARCARIAAEPDEGSVDDLRIALFFFFRARRHCGDDEPERDLAFARRMIGRIRQLLAAGGPPQTPTPRKD